MSACRINGKIYEYASPLLVNKAMEEDCEVVKVVFEGQDIAEDSYSVAWINVNKEKHLAIRWNIQNKNKNKKSKGYPYSSDKDNIPNWFVFPNGTIIDKMKILIQLYDKKANNISYVDPGKVDKKPNINYRIICVVSDSENATGDSYSVAWLENFDEKRLAIRWNKTKNGKKNINGEYIGYPHGTKEPYWFVLPRGATVLNGILVLPLEDHCK